MPYSAEISRLNPTCFLFVVDQSGSMGDSFGSNPDIQKAQFVSDALNRIFQNLVIRCAKSEGVRDYFWIGVIGYGESIRSGFAGALTERDLIPISEIAANPVRVEERTRKEPDGAGGLVEVAVKFPIWFDPRVGGATPMCQALNHAYGILQGWIDQHPDSFPPILLHITDGESTDGDPSSIVNQIKDLSTSDGHIIVMNLHVSSHKAEPVRFPNSPDDLPRDPFARLLFNLSSPLPPHMIATAEELGIPVKPGALGFVFNGGIEEVVEFLEIGTRAANLR